MMMMMLQTFMVMISLVALARLLVFSGSQSFAYLSSIQVKLSEVCLCRQASLQRMNRMENDAHKAPYITTHTQ